jgi:hypothetical protein
MGTSKISTQRYYDLAPKKNKVTAHKGPHRRIVFEFDHLGKFEAIFETILFFYHSGDKFGYILMAKTRAQNLVTQTFKNIYYLCALSRHRRNNK